MAKSRSSGSLLCTENANRWRTIMDVKDFYYDLPQDFLPYGEIGSFPIFQGKHPQNSPVRPPRYSFAKVCLALVYNIEGELVDIQVGAYITHQMLIEDNNESSATIYESECDGLIPWNYYSDSV